MGRGNEIQISPQNWPQKEIKGQVIVEDFKPKRALQQSWREAQNKTLCSLWQATKINTSRPKLSCKKRPKRGVKKQVAVGDLKQQKVLNQTWKGPQNMTISSSGRSPKMQNEGSGAKTRSSGPRKWAVRHRKWCPTTKLVSQTAVSLKRE